MKKITEKLSMFALVAPALAAEQVKLAAPGEFSPLANVTFTKLISSSMQIIMILAALIFFFILIIGGIRWILSGGDENKVKEARSQITNALIGLAIVFLAWAIAKLFESLFGVDITQTFEIPGFH